MRLTAGSREFDDSPPVSTSKSDRSSSTRGWDARVHEAAANSCSAPAARRRDHANMDSTSETSATILNRTKSWLVAALAVCRCITMWRRCLRERDPVQWHDGAAQAKALDNPRGEYRQHPHNQRNAGHLPHRDRRKPTTNNMASTEPMPSGAVTSSVVGTGWSSGPEDCRQQRRAVVHYHADQENQHRGNAVDDRGHGDCNSDRRTLGRRELSNCAESGVDLEEIPIADCAHRA